MKKKKRTGDGVVGMRGGGLLPWVTTLVILVLTREIEKEQISISSRKSPLGFQQSAPLSSVCGCCVCICMCVRVRPIYYQYCPLIKY